MMNQKPIVVLTDNARVRRSVRSAIHPRVDTLCVNDMRGIVLPLTKGQIALAVVDLASRAISGEDLMAIARVAEGRDIPLIILSRQPRKDVKGLAAVIKARDVISTTESESMIGARLRLWLGVDAGVENLPVGFSIVNAA